MQYEAWNEVLDGPKNDEEPISAMADQIICKTAAKRHAGAPKQEIRLTVREHIINERIVSKFVNLRVWQLKDEAWKPTLRGMNLTSDNIEVLIDGLWRALDVVRSFNKESAISRGRASHEKAADSRHSG